MNAETMAFMAIIAGLIMQSILFFSGPLKQKEKRHCWHCMAIFIGSFVLPALGFSYLIIRFILEVAR